MLSLVLLKHSQSLLDLGMERILVIDEVDKLRVIKSLKKHTCDLAGKFCHVEKRPLGLVERVNFDERVQAFSEDLPGLCGRSLGKDLHELLIVLRAICSIYSVSSALSIDVDTNHCFM